MAASRVNFKPVSVEQEREQRDELEFSVYVPNRRVPNHQQTIEWIRLSQFSPHAVCFPNRK